MNKIQQISGSMQKGMHGLLINSTNKGYIYLVPATMFLVFVLLIIKGC